MKGVVGLENILDAPRGHDSFFRKYQPDGVVVTSLGTFDEDRYLMREAERNGCTIISYVLSWDNTTVRGLGIGLSDKIVVWSDVMRDELIRSHKISADKIKSVRMAPLIFSFSNATKSTVSSALAFRRAFCSSSCGNACGQNRCMTFSAPS